MKVHRIALWAVIGIALRFTAASPAGAASAKESGYKGWKSLALENSLIELQVVPDIGGRVIQFKLDDHPYFWVNEALAGKKPPPGGLGPEGAWVNWGGDKLWPAPQGWGGEEEWPGPPDAVLDGSPHAGSIVAAKGDSAAVRLVSQKDKRSGIQFSRVIKVFDGSTRVSIDSTMTNIDTKPRRWGIWEVTQLNAANRDGAMNKKLRAYCPINPKSRYPRGYEVMFGLVNNPTFSADRKNGLARLDYQYRVGKIGLDCSAGWLAVVNGETGNVFVERFKYEPDKEYPDNASVEFWSQGEGTIVTGDTTAEMPDNLAENPHLIESEVLSPFANLEPGENYSFHLDWYATHIGGDHPVISCTDVGVVCQPLSAFFGGSFSLKGRFGVFYKGRIGVVLSDGGGKELGRFVTKIEVDPHKVLLLDKIPLPAGIEFPPDAKTISINVISPNGTVLGELARAGIRILEY